MTRFNQLSAYIDYIEKSPGELMARMTAASLKAEIQANHLSDLVEFRKGLQPFAKNILDSVIQEINDVYFDDKIPTLAPSTRSGMSILEEAIAVDNLARVVSQSESLLCRLTDLNKQFAAGYSCLDIACMTCEPEDCLPRDEDANANESATYTPRLELERKREAEELAELDEYRKVARTLRADR